MRWLLGVIPLLICVAVLADTITLTNGTKIEGRAIKTDAGYHVIRTDGIEIDISADDVKSIEVGRATSRPDAAAEGLASLRRAVDHLDDIPQIIDRYQRFITQNTDADVLQQAQQDLQTWQQRRDQGLVKVGNNWVTPEEHQRLQAEGQSQAMRARDLLMQNRAGEAAPILQQSILDDPDNATSLYLLGVMKFKQGNIKEARAAFTSANDLAPNHAPTLNNLAVILFQQKSYPAAMGLYDQAMVSAPQVKEILDNVAEALNALPKNEQASRAAVQAAARFRDQDVQLQQTQKNSGFYRWGSTWVTADQLATLNAAKDKISQQKEDLQRLFDAVQQKMGQIDSEVDDNTREMHRIEAGSYVTQQNGASIQMPLPQSYYDLQSDNQKLARQKQDLQNQTDDLRSQARRLEQQEQDLPIPQFTGQQSILGPEAAPLRDVTPATGPATQPS